MGAGKSAIGRQLARRLKRAFWDSDREIERRTGADISTIFEYEGEEGFRKREQAVISDLTLLKSIVLATGGGSVLREENRRNLSERGLVVYLKVSVQTQLRRTFRDRARPLLQTASPRLKLEELIAVREPLYREIAHLCLETDADGMSSVIHRIVRHLNAARAADRNE
jgi:shikimate kinase